MRLVYSRSAALRSRDCEMGRAQYIACALLLLCPLALTRHDDDFAFDNSDDFQVELTSNHSEIAKNGLRRLWGVPDTSAYVGHLFRMEIPKEAFSGKVLAYKVGSEDGRRMPSWLAVDSRHGLISGVPQKQDLGAHTFTVTAHGNRHDITATDSFTIEVKKSQDKPHSKYGICVGEESRLVLTILVDRPFHTITPRQRTRALMQLASFMALDGDEFWIEPYKYELRSETLLSGPGSSLRNRGDATTAIYVNVGCGNKLWSHHKVLVSGLREQSRDGTVAHVLQLPVIGWRLLAIQPVPRTKRQVEGSGDGHFDADYDPDDDDDDAQYSGYDDIDEEDEYTNHDVGYTDPVDLLTPAPHPHRHHHGETSENLDPIIPGAPHTTTDTFQTETAAPLPTPNIPIPTTTTTTTPSTTSPPPTTEPPTVTEEAVPAAEDTTPESATSNMYTTEVCQPVSKLYVSIACIFCVDLLSRMTFSLNSLLNGLKRTQYVNIYNLMNNYIFILSTYSFNNRKNIITLTCYHRITKYCIIFIESF